MREPFSTWLPIRTGPVWMPVFLLVLGLGGGGAAYGQARELPREMRTTEAPLTGPQQREVSEYVELHLHALREGTSSQVVDARRRLLDPLNVGNSDIFRAAYSSHLSGRLGPLADSSRVIVRLNAAILAAHLASSRAVEILAGFLGDASSSVRYWAARGLVDIRQRAIESPALVSLSGSELQRMQETLAGSLEDEKVEPVLEKILLGLVMIDDPEAIERVMDALGRRVQQHAIQPGQAPFTTDFNALRQLLRKAIETEAPAPVVRRLALLGYRYLALVSQLLVREAITPETHANAVRLVRLSDNTLRWAHGALQAPGQTPDIAGAIERREWGMVRIHVLEDWSEMLKQAPFNFGPVDLTVTVPES